MPPRTRIAMAAAGGGSDPDGQDGDGGDNEGNVEGVEGGEVEFGECAAVGRSGGRHDHLGASERKSTGGQRHSPSRRDALAAAFT
jgi:hypothetical protein